MKKEYECANCGNRYVLFGYVKSEQLQGNLVILHQRKKTVKVCEWCYNKIADKTGRKG